jgi:hypothetical protein
MMPYRTAPATPALPNRASSGPFSPARMPISRARPSTTFSSCTHQTARVSKWIYRRSSHQAMPKPTVAPSSFQPFSCPWARLAASTSAGKG